LAVFLLAVSLLSFLNFGVWVHGRHVAILFPFFVGLALSLKDDGQRVATLVLSASLLSLFVNLAVTRVNAFLP
jgi:phosphotransferase system  glucose/maltose/N-acetylglucosamine-specific IIC component